MVFLTDLARALGVPTPTMDAIVQVVSVILGRGLVAEERRTMVATGTVRPHPRGHAGLVISAGSTIACSG